MKSIKTKKGQFKVLLNYIDNIQNVVMRLDRPMKKAPHEKWYSSGYIKLNWVGEDVVSSYNFDNFCIKRHNKIVREEEERRAKENQGE